MSGYRVPECWHIITGEYPPQAGGVSDYSELLSAGLAERGCRVHVWCPDADSPTPEHTGVSVHRLPAGFRPDKLAMLGNHLNKFTKPRTILVQYVPNAFGLRGCNLPFCAWLLLRRVVHGDDVRVMFHEPFFYFARQSLRRNMLAVVTRLMAILLLWASRTVYVSIPAWRELLQPWCWLVRPPMIWLPIPSTIPHRDDPEAVAAIRESCTAGKPDTQVVGHFGTYSSSIAGILADVLKRLLTEHEHLVVKLLGNGAERFAAEFTAPNTVWRSRIHAVSALSREEVSFHLQTCDVMIQPYPDGASSRRTSLMAALSNGVPVVTTIGRLSETLWADNGVATVATSDLHGLPMVVKKLLLDDQRLEELGRRGHALYQDNFSLERTLDDILENVSNEQQSAVEDCQSHVLT